MAATTNWTKVHDGDDYARSGDASTFKKVYTFKCSSSYATGGDPVTPATDIALQSGDSIVACEVNEETGLNTYTPKYDLTNNKVLLFDKNSGAEVSSTTDVSGATFRAEFTIARG